MPLGLFGLGMSKQQSSSQSSSKGFSVSGSNDSVFGADLYQQLFSGARAAAGGVDAGGLELGANRLFDAGTGFLSALDELSGGGAVGEGERYMADALGGGDELVRQEIDSLQADLGEFYNETILPGITGEAIDAGGLGGTRQGVAQGIAGKGLLREFGRGVIDIRRRDADYRAGVASNLAATQLQRRLTAAGAGLTALPQQFQLLEAGSLAALSPFAALADILGDPTVLNDSFAYGAEESSSSSSSKGKSFQFNLGGVGG